MKELRQNQQIDTKWNGPEEEHMIIDEHTIDDEDSEENVSSHSDCTTTLLKKGLFPNPPKRFGRCQKLPNELKCRKRE